MLSRKLWAIENPEFMENANIIQGLCELLDRMVALIPYHIFAGVPSQLIFRHI